MNQPTGCSDDDLFGPVRRTSTSNSLGVPPYTVQQYLEDNDLLYLNNLPTETLKRLLYLPEDAPEWRTILAEFGK